MPTIKPQLIGIAILLAIMLCLVVHKSTTEIKTFYVPKYVVTKITHITKYNDDYWYRYRIKSAYVERCGSHTFYASDTILYDIDDTLHLTR